MAAGANTNEAIQAQAHGQAAAYIAGQIVPAHLLGGGEIVVLTIKPSLWYILFASARWLLFTGLILLLALKLPSWCESYALPLSKAALVKMALAVATARLAAAVLQWACRLYVLTDHRIMRIRGVFNIDMFECPLVKVQNTFMTLSIYERIVRLGSIHFATAGTGRVEATWHNIARPLEVHEQVRQAIGKAQQQGGSSQP